LSILKRLALASLLSVTASAAFAADATPSAQPAAPASGWQVTVGIGPQVQTAFPGARAVAVWPTGILDLRRPGEARPFSSPDDGVGLSLLDYGWIKAGPVGRLIPSRGTSNGNGAFYGLPYVGASLELGIFAELWFTEHFRARAEVRQAVSGHDGLDSNIAFDAIQKFGAFTFAIGPRVQLGDTQYMNAYFSVTPAAAFINGRVTPYQATGGLGSVGALASVKYDFLPTWSATVFGGYNRLVSSAAASPIPNNLGSLNEYTAGLLIAHAFNLELPFLP
jgi:outer membrane protein